MNEITAELLKALKQIKSVTTASNVAAIAKAAIAKAEELNNPATEKNRSMTADEILRFVGIAVECETLSDGSHVWNMDMSNVSVGCCSEKHAREMAAAIAVAIKNGSNL